MSPTNEFKLPDLFAMVPFPCTTNPHLREAGAESAAWIDNYRIFPSRKRAYFMESKAELLVANAFPYAGYDEFRAVCDFTNVLFVMDEISDDQDGEDARKTMNAHLRALRGEEPGCDESIVFEITAAFRERLLRRIGPLSMRRYLVSSENYVNAVTREAELRARDEVLNMETYRVMRRENSAVRYSFGLFEFCFGFDLPDEVFVDPVFERMTLAAVDMVSWSNDLYSYNMEQAKGHSCWNAITVIMNEKGCKLQEAVDQVGTEFQRLITQFLADKDELRSFGDETLDANVRRLVYAMENWIVGNMHWSFASQRYFGPDLEEVKKTLVVRLWKNDITA